MGWQRTACGGFVNWPKAFGVLTVLVVLVGVCVFVAGVARAQNLVATGSYSDSAPMVIPQDPNPSAASGWNLYD